MANVFKDSDTWQQEVTRSRQYPGEGSPQTLAPEATAQPASGAATASPQTVATTSAAPATPKPPMPTADILSYPGNPSVAQQYQGMFKPVTGTVWKAGLGLGNEQQEFLGAAQPVRSWAGVQGQQTVQKALEPTSDEAALTEASKLTHAAYTGPTTLDSEHMGEIKALSQSLQGSAPTYTRPVGVEALLQTQSPTAATRGELEQSAGKALADKDFLASARAVQNDIAALAAQIAQGETWAQDEAAKRTAAETDIQTQARALAEGTRAGIAGNLESQVAQKTAYDAALQAAYDKFLGTGDIQAFQGLPSEITSEVAKFNTPGQQLYQTGTAKLQEIANKYTDIKGIPFLTPQISTRGLGVLGWTPEDYKRILETYGPDWTEAIRQQAIARQKDLETAGFSPQGMTQERWGTTDTNIAGGGKGVWLDELQPEQAKRGQYADILPDLFGGNLPEWKPADVRSYLTLTQGTGATREQLATTEQRETYNRAAQLLDLEDRITQATTTSERKKLASEADRYLSDEEAALTARKETLSQNELDYYDQVRNARSAYRKAVSRGAWEAFLKPFADIVDTATFGMSKPVSEAAVGNLGKMGTNL